MTSDRFVDVRLSAMSHALTKRLESLANVLLAGLVVNVIVCYLEVYIRRVYM